MPSFLRFFLPKNVPRNVSDLASICCLKSSIRAATQLPLECRTFRGRCDSPGKVCGSSLLLGQTDIAPYQVSRPCRSGTGALRPISKELPSCFKGIPRLYTYQKVRKQTEIYQIKMPETHAVPAQGSPGCRPSNPVNTLLPKAYRKPSIRGR